MILKKIFLIRHAHSSMSTKNKDYERVLSEYGREDAEKTGLFLHKSKIVFDAFFTSSAIRAKQTSERIADRINFPVSDILIREDLYESSIHSITGLINSFDQNWVNVIVVAHNPTLSDLIDYSTGDSTVIMEAGSLAIIKLLVNDWKEFSGATAELLQYWSP